MNRQIEEANRICDEMREIASNQHNYGMLGKLDELKELLKGLSPQGGGYGELATTLRNESARCSDQGLLKLAMLLDEAADAIERAAHALKEGWETGWLIEKAGKGGICLGAVERRGKVNFGVRDFEWTTPHFALRFARKQDAEAFIEAFCHEESDGVIAVEHTWG